MPPRLITKDIARKPYVGAVCFLFTCALLSFPDNFSGGITWGCLQLLLADSGNLSREYFCGGFLG